VKRWNLLNYSLDARSRHNFSACEDGGMIGGCSQNVPQTREIRRSLWLEIV